MAEIPDVITTDLSVVQLNERGRQVEPGGTGYQPQPGIYDAVVAVCNARRQTNDGTQKKNIEWIFRVVDGPNTRVTDPKAIGSQLWKYSTFENQAMWVLDMILFATGEIKVGAHETAGKVKWSRKAQVGRPVRVVVEAGTNQDGSGYRAQLKGVFPPGEGGAVPATTPASSSSADDPFGADEGGSTATDDEPPF
jgi:hypothetical protein